MKYTELFEDELESLQKLHEQYIGTVIVQDMINKALSKERTSNKELEKR